MSRKVFVITLLIASCTVNVQINARSDDYINAIGRDVGLHPDFGSGLWEGGPIGIPYTVADATTPRAHVSFEYADESDPGPYPIPRQSSQMERP